MARYLGVDAVDEGKYYFVSYNTEDQDVVAEYVKNIGARRVPIWYDYGLKVGSEWEASIAEHINGCEAVILFVSKNIFKKKSSYVHKEYQMAISFFTKPTYVIMLDKVENRDVPIRYVSWWIDLSNLQCIQAYEHESVNSCVDEIISAIGFEEPISQGEPLEAESPQFDDIDSIISHGIKEDLFAEGGSLGLFDEDNSPKETKIPVEKGKGIPIGLLKFMPVINSGIERTSRVIEEAFRLAKLKVSVVDVLQGPRYNRYYVDFDSKIALRRVLRCDGEIRIATGINNVRIDYENGRAFVELPAPERRTVPLAEIIECKAFSESSKDKLLLPLGEYVDGSFMVEDLGRMPHILIGGATGTGKSVLVNSFLVGAMMKYTPEEVRFILFDPKTVEYTAYKGSPFLLFDHIVTDVKMAKATLRWLIEEMENRYRLFMEAGVRNLKDYNSAVKGKRLPKIVLVIDELADLIIFDRPYIEQCLMQIAQKSRAAGIHMIIATQRPSGDVITGVVKSNIPSRISLKVYAQIDSRLILDEGGAEDLTTNGDFLYKTPPMTKARRCQSAFVSTSEIRSVVEYTSEYYERDDSRDYLGEIKSLLEVPLEIRALKVAIENGTVSLAMLQRELDVGFPKAASLYDWLIDEGYLIKRAGKKAVITITMEEFNQKFKI